jgi:hypothetical protein
MDIYEQVNMLWHQPSAWNGYLAHSEHANDQKGQGSTQT